MTDVCDALNKLNKSLQGEKHHLLDQYRLIGDFVEEMRLLMDNVLLGDVSAFPCLTEIGNISAEGYIKYSRALEKLLAEFEENWFEDFRELDSDLIFFEDPLGTAVEDVPPHLQSEMQLLKESGLQCNDADSLILFQNLDPVKFPLLRDFAGTILCIFGSTYMCEQFFSSMKLAKSLTRTRISDPHLGAIMRLHKSRMKPNIKRLVSARSAKRVDRSRKGNVRKVLKKLIK